ncbi:MAG: radical SAM protein [Alphaproteobacteria bacterium]|nr:radical SAM protein [Alphaproteobacteria bacterium]
MTVEVRPLGVACNIACQYCYQNPQRDAGNVPGRYDLDAILASLDSERQPFALFGGEPLLVPIPDLERLWAYGLERFETNRIQTNGALITDEHIALFLAYKVRVGVSIDGPDELNDARWAGSLERTRAQTARSEAAIDKMCAAGVPTSLIITLHRANASAERLPRLVEWVRGLDARGILGARLHLLEVDSPEVGEKYRLTAAENVAVLEAFEALDGEVRMGLDVFSDMKRMMEGRDDKASCVWRACDPYTTAAVRSVEGSGQMSNCGRTNKDGVDFVKGDRPGYERYLALYHTPQQHGGCKDCRFFLVCKGYCPGTSLDGDWRNRTEHCDTWKSLYGTLERRMQKEGRHPLTLSGLRPDLERRMLEAWARGRNPTLYEQLHRMKRELDGLLEEAP